MAQLVKADGSQFLVEKSHTLLSGVHLAAPGSSVFSSSSRGEAINSRRCSQQDQQIKRSCMIETVVVLALGLSMAGVVLGVLTTDESV